MKSKQLRIPLLIFTFTSITLVLGKLVFDPNIGKRQLTPIVFPQTVPINGWQFQSNEPFISKNSESGQTAGKPLARGRWYRYSQNNLPLVVETIYELESFGEYKVFLKNYGSIDAAPSEQFITIRQKPGVGIYGMYVVQNNAYLTACINPRGGSTFNRQQYGENRDRHGLLGDRLIPWLFGQRSLRDARCLWSHFSIPLNKSSPQSPQVAYALLEKAWISWYQWWILHYPQE